MAKAGDRYEVTTGNIWGYAHRGDLTGVKAALARGADVDLVNTAGWTAAHAAAAGGHAKVLSALLRAGAALDIRDRGGNLALHEACKGGHASAVRVLVAAPGSPGLETVRLSQTKGAEVRALVADALRAAGKDPDSDAPEPVGYARKQVKSNAFFGPRRTPISCKLKKQLLQTKRQGRREETENNDDAGVDAESDSAVGDPGHVPAASPPPPTLSPVCPPTTGYVETVRQVKGNKLSRGARRAKAAADMLDPDGSPQQPNKRTIEEQEDENESGISSVFNFAVLDRLVQDTEGVSKATEEGGVEEEEEEGEQKAKVEAGGGRRRGKMLRPCDYIVEHVMTRVIIRDITRAHLEIHTCMYDCYDVHHHS